MQRAISAAWMSAVFFLAATSLAQPVDPAARATARKLANEGFELQKKGDCVAALEKFNLADSLVAAPTVGLEAARCLDKLGRLVEASERYIEVIRRPLGSFPPPAFRKALKSAEQERNELLLRIPSLAIRVQGPRGAGISVLLDGLDLPVGSLEAARPVDPGKHTIVVTRKDTSLTRIIKVAEREHPVVSIELPPLPPPPRPPEAPRNDRRTYGYVALGVGGFGLVTAFVAGGIALSLRGDLVSLCPDGACPPAAHGKNNAYDATRYISTTGFVLAGVGAGVGLGLLLTAPRSDLRRDTTAGELRIRIGPGSLGMEGAF